MIGKCNSWIEVRLDLSSFNVVIAFYRILIKVEQFFSLSLSRSLVFAFISCSFFLYSHEISICKKWYKNCYVSGVHAVHTLGMYSTSAISISESNMEQANELLLLMCVFVNQSLSFHLFSILPICWVFFFF